ncbi:hypothetical protein Tco_1049455 [Tanacetum coccineum]
MTYEGHHLLGLIMRLVSFTTHEAHSQSIEDAIDCTYYEAKGFKKRKVAAIDALVFPLNGSKAQCNTPPENGSNVTLMASKQTQAEDFIHKMVQQRSP